jgi:hypothetical protein
MADTPIEVLIEELEELKANGIESVSVQELLNHLHNFEKSDYTQEIPLHRAEKVKAEFSVWASTIVKQRVEMFRSVVTAGQAALKSSILINGGAAIALFAFMGNAIAHQPSTFPVSELARSAFAFIIGVLFSSIAASGTYLAQWFYSRFVWESKKWLGTTGHVINFLTWGMVLLSFVSFFYGAIACYKVLTKV